MTKKKKIISDKKMEYIEAIIYIIAIIVAVFANVYGSLYIRMIPLLFIVGIVGKIVFGRPVTTTIFGFLVTVCILHIKYSPDIMENLFLSTCTAFPIAIGELFGEYIVKIKNSNNVKKISTKIFHWIILVVTLGIFLVIHNFCNGNIIEYNICKTNLEKYIKENYSDYQNFKIVNKNYRVLKQPNYSFEIMNVVENKTGYFTIYLNNKNIINDEYKQDILDKNNNEIKLNLISYLENNNLIQKYKQLEIELKYIDFEVIKLEIDKTVEYVNEDEKVKFAKQVVEFLKDISTYPNKYKIEQLDLNMKCKLSKEYNISSSIYMKGYNENLITLKYEPFDYILKSMNVEYIDSKI